LLYDDSFFFPRTKNSNSTPVGKLSTLENDVRRKSNAEFVWIPSMKKDDIFNQDSIFTGDKSHASIKLADGSVIDIQENSLVNINVQNGQMQLDLRFGELTGTGPSTVLVKTSTDEFTINGKDGKFQVNRSVDGDVDVKVLSGKAEINGKKGRQGLKSNESMQVSDKGVEKNQLESKIVLITKEGAYFHRNNDKDPLNFEWNGKGPIAQYQLEISNEKTFKKLSALQQTTSAPLGVTGKLSEGWYFWRVKGLDGLRKVLVTSETQKFYLSYLQAPQFTSPKQDATVEAVTLSTPEGLKSSFNMAWTSNDRTLKYQWQLSNTPDFSNLLSDITLTTRTVETPSLSGGQYYSRLRGFDKDGHPSDWSPVHRVNFDVAGEEKPPAPKITNLLIKFKMPPASERAPTAADSPVLEWSSVDVAKNYRWEIAPNPQFVGAKAMDTKNTKIAWTQYSPGKHYYRVFTRTELGQLSNASETGVLQVLGSVPVLQPVPPILVQETNPQAVAPSKQAPVTWSSVSGAASYTVQMDTSPEFTNPVEKLVAGRADTLELATPGKYFVRVKANNELGDEISDYSQPVEAIYNYKIMLKKPVLREPMNKTTLFLQKDTEPYVWLEWEPVKDALTYQLELSKVADFSKVMSREKLSETRFLIKNKIPYGNIYWRVRAVPKDENFASEWTGWQFSILQQQNQGF
jgi:hypothetical protein